MHSQLKLLKRLTAIIPSIEAAIGASGLTIIGEGKSPSVWSEHYKIINGVSVFVALKLFCGREKGECISFANAIDVTFTFGLGKELAANITFTAVPPAKHGELPAWSAQKILLTERSAERSAFWDLADAAAKRAGIEDGRIKEFASAGEALGGMGRIVALAGECDPGRHRTLV